MRRYRDRTEQLADRVIRRTVGERLPNLKAIFMGAFELELNEMDLRVIDKDFRGRAKGGLLELLEKPGAAIGWAAMSSAERDSHFVDYYCTITEDIVSRTTKEAVETALRDIRFLRTVGEYGPAENQ